MLPLTRAIRPTAIAGVLWCLAAASAEGAATASAPFTLGAGHLARQELCVFVAGPGPVRVRVESAADGETLHVALYAGATPIRSATGRGIVEFEVAATAGHFASGHEWAVTVNGTSRLPSATGVIRVTYPDDGPAAPADPLDAWLRGRPALGFHMMWNDAGRPRPYSAWPQVMQQRLRLLVEEARAGQGAVPGPPANVWQTREGDDPEALHTALAPAEAAELYLAALAHALALEMDRRVPWSLADFNGDELEALLASASMFGWNPDQQAYEISEFDHGWAVPAPPPVAWQFLRDRGILGPTRRDTVTALVAWARGLTHFAGPVSRGNFRDHWGYDGDMPVARALAGTRYGGTALRTLPGYDLTRHYTAGCHGTAGLFLSVLRAANIPARIRLVSSGTFTHATVLFLSEDAALAHADDPYSQLTEGAAAADLLIDLDTYQKWLGPAASDPGRYINRLAATIALARLPAVVRRAFELDRQQGLAPERSAVFALFRDSFTLDELAAARLWERLAADAGHAPNAAGTEDRWLEAETLPAVVTAGVTEAQSMETAGSSWRGGRQLRWHGARPGARLSLPFTIPTSGRYRVSLRFTRAPDSAIVSVRLDNRTEMLDRVNLYAPVVVAADPLVMGEHDLDRGAHTLHLTIDGRHPQAAPGFGVGIDAVRVERLGGR